MVLRHLVLLLSTLCLCLIIFQRQSLWATSGLQLTLIIKYVCYVSTTWYWLGSARLDSTLLDSTHFQYRVLSWILFSTTDQIHVFGCHGDTTWNCCDIIFIATHRNNGGYLKDCILGSHFVAVCCSKENILVSEDSEDSVTKDCWKETGGFCVLSSEFKEIVAIMVTWRVFAGCPMSLKRQSNQWCAVFSY